MAEPRPLAFVWNGAAMVPRVPDLAQRRFQLGSTYYLAERDEPSAESRGHYFARLKEAWQQLPEDIAWRYPTPEHLRKIVLIKAGYYDERVIVCADDVEARRAEALVKGLDDFALVLRSGAVVKVFTAKSQSAAAMGRRVFQESKQAVLDILAEMIGVTPEELAANAGRAA